MSRSANRPLGMRIKSRLKRLLLVPAPLDWEPGYPDWRSAEAASAGYGDPSILSAAISAVRAVESGRAAYERDGVLFDSIQRSWPLLASLLYVARIQDGLRVVDVGGALGSSYRQNRDLLAGIEPLSWNVVEQPAVVKAGKEFETDALRFFDSIQEAVEGGADVALFGAALCYFENYRDVMRECFDAQVPFAIIDRTGFIPGDDHELTVQWVRVTDAPTAYPCWRFSESRLMSELSGEWEVVLDWVCAIQPDVHSVHKGFLMRRVS